MERNYDEHIAEMMRSIAQHTDTISRQQEQLKKHNRVLDRHSTELIRQSKRSEEFFKDLRERISGWEAVQNNHLERLLHTAQLIDRIIKSNKLKT